MNRTVQKIRRYAKAMLDVAEQSDRVEAVCADLMEVRRWMEVSPAFHVFAACDHLGQRENRLRALLDLANAARLERQTAEFLVRIEGARVLEHLGDILNEFERLRSERAGVVHAEITSARPLAEDQRAELIRRLRRGVGDRPMDVSYKEDPEILGGFVARIDEKIHDYSVSGRLARLRRRLADA